MFAKGIMRYLNVLVVVAILVEPVRNENKTAAYYNGKGLFSFLFKTCDCRCGVSNRRGKLLGGDSLMPHEFPWLATIQVKDGRAIPATLINDRYLVTAANPLQTLTPFDIKVTLGQFNRCLLDISSSNFSVQSIVIHPHYSYSTNDIALIKLSLPLNFEERVSPVCLSTPGRSYIGQVATLASWYITDSKNPTCVPRKIGMPVLENTACLENKSIAQETNCLGIVGLPSPVCEDDTGGPVMYRSYSGIYELIGILSNNSCNDNPGTASFTNLNTHLSWITNETRDACYCIKF